MSKQREVLRLLSLGLSSRMIISSVHVGPQTITEIRKLCADRGLSYEEALKLDDDELFAKKKKTSHREIVAAKEQTVRATIATPTTAKTTRLKSLSPDRPMYSSWQRSARRIPWSQRRAPRVTAIRPTP